jgi:hypothetical protein
MDSPKNLQLLPTEILCSISSYLAWAEVWVLRQVCVRFWHTGNYILRSTPAAREYVRQRVLRAGSLTPGELRAVSSVFDFHLERCSLLHKCAAQADNAALLTVLRPDRLSQMAFLDCFAAALGGVRCLQVLCPLVPVDLYLSCVAAACRGGHTHALLTLSPPATLFDFVLRNWQAARGDTIHMLRILESHSPVAFIRAVDSVLGDPQLLPLQAALLLGKFVPLALLRGVRHELGIQALQDADTALLEALSFQPDSATLDLALLQGRTDFHQWMLQRLPATAHVTLMNYDEQLFTERMLAFIALGNVGTVKIIQRLRKSHSVFPRVRVSTQRLLTAVLKSGSAEMYHMFFSSPPQLQLNKHPLSFFLQHALSGTTLEYVALLQRHHPGLSANYVEVLLHLVQFFHCWSKLEAGFQLFLGVLRHYMEHTPSNLSSILILNPALFTQGCLLTDQQLDSIYSCIMKFPKHISTFVRLFLLERAPLQSVKQFVQQYKPTQSQVCRVLHRRERRCAVRQWLQWQYGNQM